MPKSLDDKISRSRMLLQNPYAYLNGEGGFDAAAQADLQEQISASRLLLENPYAYLTGDGEYCASTSKRSAAAKEKAFEIDVEQIRNPSMLGKRVSFETIEGIVKRLQVAIWINRKAIWGEKAPDDPIQVLDPEIVFKAIGYTFESDRPLGEMIRANGTFEVAGLIDRSKRYVGISSQVPYAMRQFTAAQELGHALLHRAEGLHRDRGLDGSPVPGPRARIEIEADKFATYFLMPSKLLISEFEARFGPKPFLINDGTSFALISDSSDALRGKVKNRRGLARALADASYYGGARFLSLSERFRVSTEAMAIRLEELKLLEF